MTEPILAPMLALVGWTFVMWTWMYATRFIVFVRNGLVLLAG